MISHLDWDILEGRIDSEVAKHKHKDRSTGLLALSMQQLFPSIGEELIESITDGPNDRGIDAVHVIEKDDNAEVYLIQAKYREKKIRL
jgi:hypothetical protein